MLGQDTSISPVVVGSINEKRDQSAVFCEEMSVAVVVTKTTFPDTFRLLDSSFTEGVI
jgi:hypothetical protein